MNNKNSNYYTEPIKYKTVNDNKNIIYTPLATKHNYGVVKIGKGLDVNSGEVGVSGVYKVNISFTSKKEFENWLEGTFERLDGLTPEVLDVNSVIRFDSGETHLWCYRKSTPLTIDDFKFVEGAEFKQNIRDDSLITTSKTIPGAINETYDLLQFVGEDIRDNVKPKITQNTNDIADLKEKAISGLNRVGTFPTQVEFPSNEQLNAFVLETEGRTVRNGDWVEFVKADTQDRYKIYYTANKWQAPDLQAPIEKAEENRYGVIKGNSIVKMANGEVVSLNSKNLNGIYENIEPRINAIDLMQKNIISGDQFVKNSTNAQNDGEGVNISNNYAKIESVYTKEQANKRFLDKNYANTYYYSRDGIVDTLPTTPEDERQFELTTSSYGFQTIFSLDKVLEGNYIFSKNTADTSILFMSCNNYANSQLRLTTYAIKDGETKILSVQESGMFQFFLNNIHKITMTSIYNGLGNEELEMNTGDVIRKRLEIFHDNTYDKYEKIYTLYCGKTYASTVQLVGQNISLNFNAINGKQAILIDADDWLEDDETGVFYIAIPPEKHRQAISDEYGIDVQYRNTATSSQRVAVTPEIRDDGTIIIRSYKKIACKVLIWSALAENERAIFELSNPSNIPDIDYSQFGAINITQTEEPAMLTLPIPKDVVKFYTVYVSNDKSSTKTINVNENEIAPNDGVAFRWARNTWLVDNFVTTTDDIIDGVNNRPLNDTLQMVNDNFDEVNLLTGDVADLEQNKTNSKSIELKEGIDIEGVPVTTLVDLFKFFYYKRKDQNPIYELEVGNGKNTNVTDILGFPYGESPTRPGSIVFERGSTSGIGFVINCQFVGEDSKTSHIGAIKGWIISGTSYDNKIHFTGWNSLTPTWNIITTHNFDFNGSSGLSGSSDLFVKTQDNSYVVSIKKDNKVYNGFLILLDDTTGTVTIPLDDEFITYKLTKSGKNYIFDINQSVNRVETLEITIYGRR